MSADALISRLESVKSTGHGRWIAKCPAHDDRKASLSIREVDDGRILVHDFAGCSVEDVLSAVDLTFDALFPERPMGQFKSERRPFPAADVLRAVEFEVLVAACCASTMAKGESLSTRDRKRLMLAAERICAAVQEFGNA